MIYDLNGFNLKLINILLFLGLSFLHAFHLFVFLFLVNQYLLVTLALYQVNPN